MKAEGVSEVERRNS